MVARKPEPPYCAPVADPGCGNTKPAPPPKKAVSNRKVYRLLDEQGAVVSRDDQKRFADFLDRSVRHRKLVQKRWSLRDGHAGRWRETQCSTPAAYCDRFAVREGGKTVGSGVVTKVTG